MFSKDNPHGIIGIFLILFLEKNLYFCVSDFWFVGY